ncbi:hypothetical protein BAY61_04520 [Prauserella marina]|uniref:Uncharacterized protein n=1 Tax=Prauserella marina TaxID=530584 RepID=A0A222VKC7_9PSEU|nr:hypothetical protein [Prauserella marina]ASR34380.1 hypothetical protein BAY61_04520 [Prauserella marina]PWV70580.1 hypothetical protein DES30_11527 [Prauserella marina]SDE03149.1 hypothetical protein SAMN05421630_11828 [Prauserella marina]
MEEQAARTAAARGHRVLEPLHSLVYFAGEAESAFVATGLDRGRMCYFASRAAPFGPVGPGAVAATFNVFNPDLIAEYLPRAWTLATPADILAARADAAGLALRRLLGDELADSAAVTELAGLVREAAEAAPVEGRALFAAHADLPWPADPLQQLWHGASLLREFRGDGHVAILLGHRLSGLAALVTHTATGRGFTVDTAKKRRGWSDEQWTGAVTELTERGVLDGTGALTEEGRAERDAIEAETDAVTSAPWLRIGIDKSARIQELGAIFSKRVVAEGAYPPGLFATGR